MKTSPAELTEAQTQELRAKLAALVEELEGSLEATRDEARPVDVDSAIGRLSRLDSIQRHEMAGAERRRNEERLRLAKRALADIASGDYGSCDRCDSPIGYGRLRARPEVRVCIRCQEHLEAAG